MSDKSEVIRAICRIPLDFPIGNKSFYQLVRESKYAEFNLAITVEDLSNHLRSEQGLIEAWIQWSEDKRVSSGPYLQRTEKSLCVGVVPEDGTWPEPQEFESPIDACAYFIMQELSELSDAT